MTKIGEINVVDIGQECPAMRALLYCQKWKWMAFWKFLNIFLVKFESKSSLLKTPDILDTEVWDIKLELIQTHPTWGLAFMAESAILASKEGKQSAFLPS